MKASYTLAFFLCSSISLLAQTNYVNNAANSVNPGLRNTLVGPSAGQATANGTDNVFLGANAGSNNTDGNNNTFIGANAGLSNTNYNNNTFVGCSAGNQNTVGYYNTFMGVSAGYFSSSGYQNTYIGMNAGFGNSSGTNNTYLGFNSGQLSNTGTQNTFVGSHAGLQTQGANNTFVGYLAGSNNTTGSNNVLIGPSSGTVIITGDDNIMLGANTQPSNGNIHNAIAIGSNAKVALDNAIVLGDPANTSIAVGIGTDSPQFPLDVRGIINVRNNGTIKFSHLSNIVYQGATNQFLTVNEQGETVLAKHRLRIDHVNQWSDRVFSSGYLLRPLTEIASYIQQNGHLPGVPSAEEVVKEGVDLVKMNALLLEKVEELTLYSIQQQRRIDQLEKTDQVNHQLQIELAELKGLVKQLLDKK